MPLPAILLGLAPVLPALTRLVPELARWLAGERAEEVATGVVDVVRTVVGSDDPAAVQAALASDATALQLQVQLAGVVAQQEAAREAALLAQMQVIAADAADARARDLALRQAGHRNVRADVMVGLVVVGEIACLGFLNIAPVERGGAVEGAVLALMGLLGKCFADAFSFEFGSSRGSADRAASQERTLGTAMAALTGPLRLQAPESEADALNRQSYERAKRTR